MQSKLQQLNKNSKFVFKYLDYNEIQLIKSLPNTYVRFRLDGLSFPPNILYKICSAGVVDINSFAPRNYKCPSSNAWYLRADRNEWRSINYQVISKTIRYSHLHCVRETSRLNRKISKEKRWKSKYIEDFSDYAVNWTIETILEI
eukprot:NODE_452_length_8270_cov_0.487823.p5 type:complete len:145 gc:universal NODE_452_length_8270_cov_0.487823:5449-5883(+)